MGEHKGGVEVMDPSMIFGRKEVETTVKTLDGCFGGGTTLQSSSMVFGASVAQASGVQVGKVVMGTDGIVDCEEVVVDGKVVGQASGVKGGEASGKAVGKAVGVTGGKVRVKSVDVALIFGSLGVEKFVVEGDTVGRFCREDEIGGDGWTRVNRKKGNPPKETLVGKPKGFSNHGRWQLVGENSGQGKIGNLKLDTPPMKPMLVYKRVWRFSGGGKFAASKCLCPCEEVIGNPGFIGRILKVGKLVVERFRI